jgi:hypothetical protein
MHGQILKSGDGPGAQTQKFFAGNINHLAAPPPPHTDGVGKIPCTSINAGGGKTRALIHCWWRTGIHTARSVVNVITNPRYYA